MAKKQTDGGEGILVGAAKKIGAAAGKVASLTGAQGDAAQKQPEQTSGSAKRGKLPKRNKARLPRKLKKAQKKQQSA